MEQDFAIRAYFIYYPRTMTSVKKFEIMYSMKTQLEKHPGIISRLSWILLIARETFSTFYQRDVMQYIERMLEIILR